MMLMIFFIIGLTIGLSSRIFIPKGGLGLAFNIVIGVTGALAGGFITNQLSLTAFGIWGPLSLSSILSVLLLIATNKLYVRPRRTKKRSHPIKL